MGCFVSKQRHQAVCQELENLKEYQSRQEHGSSKARLQAIRDRNHLMDVQTEVTVLQQHHQAVCQELKKLKEHQAVREHGFSKARLQAIRDRNQLKDVQTDVTVLQTQLFDTSTDLMKLAESSDARVVFRSLPLKTVIAFKATLL